MKKVHGKRTFYIRLGTYQHYYVMYNVELSM